MIAIATISKRLEMIITYIFILTLFIHLCQVIFSIISRIFAFIYLKTSDERLLVIYLRNLDFNEKNPLYVRKSLSECSNKR